MQQDTTSAMGRAAEATTGEQPVSLKGNWAPNTKKIGICCSGGGVRSASFNLGALQALQEEDILQQADYLASVSGGGYIAGAMTMLAGSRQDLVWADGRPKPFELGSPEEKYLRNRSSYLAPGYTGKSRLLANVLRGLLLNLVVLAAVVAFAGFLLGWLASYVATLPGREGAVPMAVRDLRSYGPLVLLGVVAALLLYGGVTRSRTAPREDKILRTMRWATRGAVALWLVLVAAPWAIEQVSQAARGQGWLVDTLNWAYGLVGEKVDRPDQNATTTVGQIGAILGALGLPALLGAAAKTVFRSASTILGRIAIWLVVPLLGASVLLTAAVAARSGIHGAEGWIVAGEVVVFLFAGYVADINAGSMHRFYKRRLCTAFALERVWRKPNGKVAELKENAPLPAEGSLDAIERDYDARVKLSEAVSGNVGNGRWPQLVCCAAANIGDETVTPPGRLAVTFTFDSDWIGGPQVGYAKTEDYEDVLGDVRAEDVTIPAAVAISGAALAPCMGIMTKPYLRALLTLVNARLGVWLPSPGWIDAHEPDDGKKVRSRPSFFWLLKEANGRNKHDADFLYVTDGGHWENLGLVELLRRGCGTIYCIDASGDKEDTFFTIGQAISMASSELGVTVNLAPDVMKPDPDDLPYCKDDHAIGTITFPSEDATKVVGRIALIKAQVTREAPWDVRAYKEKDPAFPNHGLLEQMFADQTFEAYRRLGYETARRAARSMTWRTAATPPRVTTPENMPVQPDNAATLAAAGTIEPGA